MVSYILNKIRAAVRNAFLAGIADGIDVLEGRTEAPTDGPAGLLPGPSALLPAPVEAEVNRKSKTKVA